MKFSDITGLDEIKRRMAQSVDEGRISHAQLLSGDCGRGALPLALAYAQYVNCTSRRDGDSCGECPSCRKIAELVHPDLHFVYPVNKSGKKSGEAVTSDMFLPQWRELFLETGGYFDEQMWYRAIDMENQQGLISRAEADSVIQKLSFKAFEARYKVMIIWLPEKMRPEAANSLLKILEEPWEGTLFLMVSAAPRSLLPTILSRTQETVLPAIDTAAVEDYLRRTCRIEPEAAHTAARLCGGDLLRGLAIARSGGGDENEYFQMFQWLMRYAYNDKHLELLQWAEDAAAAGREQQKEFFGYALRMLRESYMLNAGMEEISCLWGSELDFCRKFSPFIGNHNIEALIAEIESAAAQIGQNGNAKIIFTHFALVVSKLIVKI